MALSTPTALPSPLNTPPKGTLPHQSILPFQSPGTREAWAMTKPSWSKLPPLTSSIRRALSPTGLILRVPWLESPSCSTCQSLSSGWGQQTVPPVETAAVAVLLRRAVVMVLCAKGCPCCDLTQVERTEIKMPRSPEGMRLLSSFSNTRRVKATELNGMARLACFFIACTTVEWKIDDNLLLSAIKAWVRTLAKAVVV